MKKKPSQSISKNTDVPYDPDNESEVMEFWKDAITHTGLDELRVKRGRPPMKPQERKEQVALRIDRDILEWFRAQGAGWQTRMNDALRQFKEKN